MKRSGNMIIDLSKDKLSLAEAIFIAKPYDILLLDDKEYNEKIVIDKPYLTLIGKNNTIISYDDHADTIKDGKKLGTTGSTTFKILEDAIHTTLENITIKNNYKKQYFDCGGEQAVAFKSSASYTKIKNCKFISYQDTFYIDLGYMNLVMDSYIEGDVDFIFGSADCLFYNTIICAKSLIDKSYYTAPSTITPNRYGLVFYKSKFIQQNNIKTDLGRAWYPKYPSPVLPRLALIECELVGNINLEIIQMHEGNPMYQELIIKNSIYNDKKIDNGKDFNYKFIEKTLKYFNE